MKWLVFKDLRNILLYIVLFVTCDLNAQTLLNNDTVKIGEVIIERVKYGSELPGYKTERLDSSILSKYSQLTLADVLENSLNISVKSYGMGGTATAAFRGTGAGHTIVDWNGIDIGNPMLGQSDLSLISSGMSDGITVYYGGASMTVDNGGIGGIINLVTGPDWNHETDMTLSTGTGSFGNYSGLIKFKKGTENFQSSTKIFMQKAENDFR
ncbi:MAG TPA: TonB-dependent receptor plug domain-containing protein, partial [Bacteroidales bacterium]|nr:TonB-dependent receptor plug domain-containing protein [Bacteroidales bacterium]